jgi:NAD(P)H-hydrate epimerase
MIKQFQTDTGILVPAITTAQMREVDRIALEETGPNLYQMMENAGRNLAAATLQFLGPQWRTATVVVLSGSGGNGGGGICAARHLANRGLDVRLCLTNPSRLDSVPAFQRQVFRSTPGVEVEISQLQELRPGPDIILDALVGYSLRGAPQSTVAELIRWANRSGASILSLDVPSGVDSTEGETPGEFIRARWTVTLALPKTGLSPEKTGELWLADIGIPEGVYRRLNLDYEPPFGNRCLVPLLPA